MRFTAEAQTQLAAVLELSGEDIAPLIERVLATGPRPHAYRRIRERQSTA